MKVKKLIKMLRKVSPNAEVKAWDGVDFHPVTGIYYDIGSVELCTEDEEDEESQQSARSHRGDCVTGCGTPGCLLAWGHPEDCVTG